MNPSKLKNNRSYLLVSNSNEENLCNIINTIYKKNSHYISEFKDQIILDITDEYLKKILCEKRII